MSEVGAGVSISDHVFRVDDVTVVDETALDADPGKFRRPHGEVV